MLFRSPELTGVLKKSLTVLNSPSSLRTFLKYLYPKIRPLNEIGFKIRSGEEILFLQDIVYSQFYYIPLQLYLAITSA